MTYIREDQADISFTVDGITYGDSWSTFEGGDLEYSADGKTRPGGGGAEVSVGTTASRSDVTITTQLTDIVLTWHKTLENLVSEGGVPCKVGVNFKHRRRRIGPSFTLTGTIKSARLPNTGGGTGIGMYTVVMECDEQAA